MKKSVIIQGELIHQNFIQMKAKKGHFMEMNESANQPASKNTETPPTGEPKPVSKNWQDYARQILYFLRDWFLKLKIGYKIILIVVVAAILVLILLAYLGIFGQEPANLIKQLVNKILDQIKSKKS